MSKINLYNPCSLLESSIKSIFDICGKEVIDHLRQIPLADALGVASIVNRRAVIFSKYEHIFESTTGGEMFTQEWDDFCMTHFESFDSYEEIKIILSVTCLIESISFSLSAMFPKTKKDLSPVDSLWRLNAVYKLVNSNDGADVVKSYYEMRDTILSLQEPNAVEGLKLPKLTTFSEEVLCYYDPLCFFPVCNPDSGRRCVSIVEISKSISFLSSSVRETMSYLLASKNCIARSLYNLSILPLLQMEKTFSEIAKIAIHKNRDEPIGRDESTIKSLKLINCLRNLNNDVGKIKKSILPAMKACNFVPLEDIMGTFHFVDAELYTNEVMMLFSVLKSKYHHLIEGRRFRIKCLLEKIKLIEECKTDEEVGVQVSIDSINRSVKKMSDEVKEMEAFVRNFSCLINL
ncbi:hypothetical protein [Candidatus Ichthyocystis hellenicum]|uniref:hypothetical protein n=1 Tax=Candidatus Ichthyocystis hellenicum TaxID=1561003 RepID=UPI000B897C3D|nr:hypothetical protein [Candidatus Ichthyocystis hellenicum]